ncbi:MAG: alpha/beta hydrolase [Oceanicoccus sp.]
MKITHLVFPVFIILNIVFSSITHAMDASITELNTCKTKPKHATCYQALLPETTRSHQAVSIDIQYWQATGERLNPYPIVWLAGGPGTTNLNPPMPEWVWEHFDVLAIGYRGIDGKPRLDCPSLRKQFKKEGKNSNDDFLSTTSIKRLSEKVEDCQQHWESSGINTQAYGVYEVVEDIDNVRKLLGFEKINLLSVSYGTRVAWYFDQLKPGIIDRSLIMSGNPDGGFFFNPIYTQLQLKTLEKLCHQNNYCNRKLPNLTETILTVLTNLPEKAWGVHLDADQIRLVTFMMLYSRNSMPMVIDAYSKASDGNYSGLVAMQKFPNPFAEKEMVWGTFLSAGSIDLGAVESFSQQLQISASNTTINAPLSELLYGGITNGWKARDYQPLTSRITDTPTLIVASEIDVATPIERIEKFWMPYISNGALITVEGAGHAQDFMFAGGPELGNHMMQFLQTGLATTDQSFGMEFEFEPSLSLSWITYGFWGLVAGISIGLVVAAIMFL